jgi:hypothetical protein
MRFVLQLAYLFARGAPPRNVSSRSKNTILPRSQ